MEAGQSPPSLMRRGGSTSSGIGSGGSSNGVTNAVNAISFLPDGGATVSFMPSHSHLIEGRLQWEGKMDW